MRRTPSMQRVLQAGSRAGRRACSARRLECATGLYPGGCFRLSSPSRSAAMPSAALHGGSISDARQQPFQPAFSGAGRQAYASAAQAASVCQQQQQPFSFRQASNERPAPHARQQEPTADVRIAVVARLARSLGERGFVDDEREGEHATRQQTSCREVADVMGAALQQGASGQAIELFKPDRLLQERGMAAADMCDMLLRACGALGEVRLMLLTVQSMRTLRIPVGYVAHGCVLSGLARANRLQEAMQYLSDEVPPEAQTAPMHNTILEAALHSGDGKLALGALQHVCLSGSPRNSRTAAAALRIMGRWQTEDTVLKSWTRMEPQLKQHVTVNAAYVEALCMRSHVHEAMRAFEQMLELYAAQYHSERSQEAGTHSQHLRTQSIALTNENRHGSSSIDMQQPSDSYNGSHQAQSLEQRRAGMSQAAHEQAGAMGQDSSCASPAEPASVAQRAAQAACHQILNAAAREGLATISTDVLRALHQTGVQPDTAIYNSIMRQQAAAGLGSGALQGTLADMEAHGLTPDRRSLFALLRAFSREGDLAGAMHVMHRMAQLDIAPDRFTYNALMEAYVAADDLQGVADMYKAMTTRGIQPDICTFVALFKSLKASSGAVGLLQEEDTQPSWLQRLRGSAYVAPQELLRAWRADFDSSGLRHSPESFTALVQALGQAQQIDEMLQLLADAWSGATPLRPSIYACNSAVGACARAGRLDEALRLCSAMEKQGLRADAYTYSLLMNGYALAKQPDMAYMLFHQMQERGLQPNVYIYNALMKAQAGTGNIGEALQLLDVMIEADVRPDGATWQTLLSQSKYVGRYDVADLVTERMQGRIQQWPQYILREGQSAWHEQSPQSTQATPDQGVKGLQPYGFAEGEEDEDDDDMFGGPRF